MIKAFFNWLKGGSGSATKQKELDEANAAPYKVEAPTAQEEKVEKAALQNGDLDAPVELVERAIELHETTVKPVEAKPKAKRTPKPKAETAAKPKKPRTPRMTVAK